jgi:hypothetical protein
MKNKLVGTGSITALIQAIVLLIALLPLLKQLAAGQLVPASPPIADLSDTRFKNVVEDWTSPFLVTSHLIATPPVIGYINDNSTYTVELLQVQWRFGDPIDLYVMKPKGVKKPPVILYLYGYPADTDRFKNPVFQRAVTKDGLAAVGFVSALTGHRYHDRPMREWFLSQLQESLAASAHDVQMILSYLAGRGDMDMSRVGMFAQGSGASIAILASAADSRIKVLDLLDPWGDWPTWITTSPFVPEEERVEYDKPEFLNKVDDLEPLKWLPKVQARKLRLQDALFDANTPGISKQRLRAALPRDTTVQVYKSPEDFNEIIRNGTDLEWINRQLQTKPE